MMSYYCTHNSRGDIIGIYNGDGVLRAQYKYDAWGKVLSVTDGSDNAITSPTHVGNLNPFRYRGYYYDTESGFYYLMSRYYDPVTHRFINADGYFQSGGNILDANMSAYCANNPIMYSDPTGKITVREVQYDIVNNPNSKWNIKDVTNALKSGLGYDDDINKLGTTSNNYTVYTTKTYSSPSVTNNTYWVYDNRDAKDPNMMVVESHLVDIKEIQLEIIDMLLEYEKLDPTNWDRYGDSLAIEWDVHNDIYNIFHDSHTKSVDLDNDDAWLYDSIDMYRDCKEEEHNIFFKTIFYK